MKAFICVYRHPEPRNIDIKRTQQVAEKSPLVQKFLDEYPKPNCFFDWGDDPAFFSANELLGDFRYATWGICRRDVRRSLSKKDIVIYFCARQNSDDLKVWDYYFIGSGIVIDTIARDQIWQGDRYAVYRDFLNVLAKLERSELVQHEFFGKGHDDWRLRSQSPYILFDPIETDFNLVNPLHVATRYPDSLFEEWNSNENELVNDLESSLFKNFKIDRRLRTRSKQYIHRHISLHNFIDEAQRVISFRKLRSSATG
jgi:hypothetical protein